MADKGIKIPRCMSTQHPDNVNSPFFSQSTELGGEDEIKESYYAFSHLQSDEQMWDCEGKEVDNYVVKKLLTTYDTFFRERILGKDKFLTLRVPNPTVERAEAKILLETLESIPRSYDAAKLFYGEDIAPIFEVILPMTASAACLNRVYKYYSDFIIDRQKKSFNQGDITIADWIGEFKPDRIQVIPLFESKEHMLNSHVITGEYMKNKNFTHQRVFLARSDPAMNYGLVSAVLLNKIALKKLYGLSEETGIPIYPIIGVGSAPFRGNLRPQTVDHVCEEYPSVHTFTIQSSFKYDNHPEEVVSAVQQLLANRTKKPVDIDEERSLDIIKRYADEFIKQVRELAPVINEVAQYVPKRRKRKLHIGLFGYSRMMDELVLPRAITFTASLYSLGVPPEILGINALTPDDLKYIRSVYLHFDDDIRAALEFCNMDSPYVPQSIRSVFEKMPVNFNSSTAHKEQTNLIINALKTGKTHNIADHVLKAANIRKFLG